MNTINKKSRILLPTEQFLILFKDDAEATKIEASHFLSMHAASINAQGTGINWFKGPIYDIWQHMVVLTSSPALGVSADVAEITSFGFQSYKLTVIL